MAGQDHVDAHVHARYDLKEKLGKGAYGIVWRAVDRETKDIVAVKKIFDAFQNVTDAQRTFREIGYLQAFDHPNIVKLLDVMKADNDKDIYLVFEHMDTDLHRARKLLQPVHMPFIAYQVIKALYYMHSGGVLHRDLKPANVLVNDECLCKLADFGLARSVGEGADAASGGAGGGDGAGSLTNYLGTRWYRSPELLLGSERYTGGSDMWSVGCILGELISGAPLFPGDTQRHMIELIIACIGRPSPSDVAACEIAGVSDLERVKVKPGRGIEVRFASAGPDAVDFLKRLLAFNPKKRITAADALGHAYLKPFRDRDTELSLSRSVRVAVEDAKRLSIKDYRTRLYREIQENLARLKAARSPPRAVIPMADHDDQAPASLAGAPRPAREKDATRPREQSSRAKPGPVEPDASAFAALSIGDRRHAPSQRSGAGGGAVAASVGITSPPKDKGNIMREPRVASARAHEAKPPPVAAAAATKPPVSDHRAGVSKSHDEPKPKKGAPERTSAGAIHADDQPSLPVRVAPTALHDDEPILDVYGRRVGRKRTSAASLRSTSSTIFGGDDVGRTSASEQAPLANVYGQPSRAQSARQGGVGRAGANAQRSTQPW